MPPLPELVLLVDLPESACVASRASADGPNDILLRPEVLGGDDDCPIQSVGEERASQAGAKVICRIATGSVNDDKRSCDLFVPGGEWVER